MADINIQRKKSAPSPWVLVLLVAVAVAVAAYLFLRPAPADEASAPARTGAPAPTADTAGTGHAAPPAPAADTGAVRTARRTHTPPAAGTPPSVDADGGSETATGLATQASTNPASPNYAQNGLQKLTGVLVALTDRDDLRDPTIAEQRDNLTSATSRLGEAGTSPRPGFVAAAALMRAMQQKAYPDLDGPAADLTRLASQLSGRSATAAEQRQNQQFLTQAAAVVRVLSEPARTSSAP